MLYIFFEEGSPFTTVEEPLHPECWERDGNMVVWFVLDHAMLDDIRLILYVYE